MAVDTFICGVCHTTFHEMDAFVEHKKAASCTPVETQEAVQTITTDPAISSADIGNGVQLIIMPAGMMDDATEVGAADGSQVQVLLGPPPEGSTNTATLPQQQQQQLAPQPATATPTPARRKGRPRKGEERQKPVKEIQKEPEKPSAPEKGKDGRLYCTRCKRGFTRERFFVTHKCLAATDYVDISRKGAIKTESGSDLDDIMDDDDDEDEDMVEFVEDGDAEFGIGETGEFKTSQLKHPNISSSLGPDTEPVQLDTSVTVAGDVPVFRTEEDKMVFEESLQVDLSGLDGMFKTHVIEQNVNENAPPPASRSSSQLCIYSCITCNKVFKTISHMRLHCLIHTDLKPFKCSKCTYASNSKGNLYTHMRKHTGQFYRCQHCNFRTVNKTHQIEHEAIHLGQRHKCDICHKDYNTTKSLTNHVRKYHMNSKAGREYMKKFQVRHKVRGEAAVLHQCHICNRKFKKKIDRDRHLFVHNVVDKGIVNACELCDYTASRKAYLEKHFRKHRIVYRCALCEQKFLSTIRLNQHIMETHISEDNPDQTWDSLFELSINNSLYLPETDGSIAHYDEALLFQGDDIAGSSDEQPGPLVAETAVEKEGVDAGEVENNDTPVAEFEAPSEESTEANQAELHPDSDDVSNLLLLRGSSEREPGEGVDKATDPSCSAGGFDAEQGEKECAAEKAALPIRAEGDEEDMETDCVGESAEVPKSVDKVVTEETHIDSASAGDGSKEVAAGREIDGALEVAEGDSLMHDESKSKELVPEEGKDLDDDSSQAAALLEQEELTLGELGMETGALPSAQEDVPVGGQGSTNQEAALGEEDAAVEELAAAMEEDEDDDEQDAVAAGEEEESGIAPPGGDTDADGRDVEDDIFKRLQYLPLNSVIFHKIREAFGNEECEYCGRLFYSKTDYETHVRTHTGDKPFSCDMCEYRANTKDNLKRHMEKEHEKVVFKCKDCEYVASSRTQLWNHALKHRKPPEMNCTACNLQFTSTRKFRDHIVTKHPEMSLKDAQKLTGYSHRLTGRLGRRTFKCPYCSRVFLRANTDLQKHIWMHEGIKPFKCTLCPHACRSQTNLTAHMMKHSNEKPFLCNECGKAYKSKTALRWHVRTHKDGKIFKCTKCPYEAIQRSHLKRHMETHDIVKRFICHLCDFSANTQAYMKVHYTRHHKGAHYIHNPMAQKPMASDAKVYKCVSCDYLFGNLSDMKRHLRIRHHIIIGDIQALESAEGAHIVEGTPEVQAQSAQEVQYVQLTEQPGGATAEEEDARSALQALQYSVPEQLDESTASAVNILQQIIDMSQQGTLSNHEITVQSEDGQMVAVNPDTIIVQQGGEEVVVASSSAQVDGNQQQYVIQYVNQDNELVSESQLVQAVAASQMPHQAVDITVAEAAQVQEAIDAIQAHHTETVGTSLLEKTVTTSV